jgi:hypothetical protein
MSEPVRRVRRKKRSREEATHNCKLHEEHGRVDTADHYTVPYCSFRGCQNGGENYSLGYGGCNNKLKCGKLQ